jgi:hypothetical protein
VLGSSDELQVVLDGLAGTAASELRMSAAAAAEVQGSAKAEATASKQLQQVGMSVEWRGLCDVM